MATDTIDQQFIKYIVESIVGQPDAVKVERTIDEKGVLLELTVAPDDLGRVIGKRGNTAQSLRTLLRALGTKNDARYNLKIVDVGGPRPAPVAASPAVDDNQAPIEDTSSTPADTPSNEVAATSDDDTTSSGADAWAHLRSNDTAAKDSDTSVQDDTQSSTDEDNEEPSVVEKTRKELEDIAKFDI